MTSQDYNTAPFDQYSKHELGDSIYRLRNYESLKKEAEHLFANGYAFFTESKLLELAKTYNIKLVARGHITIDIDRHDRPVYSSKVIIESQNFTGPHTEHQKGAFFWWIIFIVVIVFFVIIILLGISDRLSREKERGRLNKCWAKLTDNKTGKFNVARARWVKKKLKKCKRKMKRLSKSKSGQKSLVDAVDASLDSLSGDGDLLGFETSRKVGKTDPGLKNYMDDLIQDHSGGLEEGVEENAESEGKTESKDGKNNAEIQPEEVSKEEEEESEEVDEAGQTHKRTKNGYPGKRSKEFYLSPDDIGGSHDFSEKKKSKRAKKEEMEMRDRRGREKAGRRKKNKRGLGRREYDSAQSDDTASTSDENEMELYKDEYQLESSEKPPDSVEYRRKIPQSEDNILDSRTFEQRRKNRKHQEVESDETRKSEKPAYLGASSAKGYRPSENYEDVSPLDIEIDGQKVSKAELEPDETLRVKKKRDKNRKRRRSSNSKDKKSTKRKGSKTRGKKNDSEKSGSESLIRRKSAKHASDKNDYDYTSGSVMITPKREIRTSTIYTDSKTSNKKLKKKKSKKVGDSSWAESDFNGGTERGSETKRYKSSRDTLTVPSHMSGAGGNDPAVSAPSQRPSRPELKNSKTFPVTDDESTTKSNRKSSKKL